MSKRKPYRGPKYQPGIIGAGLVLSRINNRGEDNAALRDDQQVDLGNGYRLALLNLTHGTASRESWDCVVCALNIALTLAESVFQHQHEDDIVKALDGAFRANIRFRTTGNFRLDGTALNDAKFALEVHAEQLKLAHKKEILAAMATVRERIKSGHVYTSEVQNENG